MIRRMDAVVVSILNKTGSRDATEADVAEQKAAIRAAARERRVVKRERKPNG